MIVAELSGPFKALYDTLIGSIPTIGTFLGIAITTIALVKLWNLAESITEEARR